RSRCGAAVIPSLAGRDGSDIERWLNAAGTLWCTGATLDGSALPGRSQRRRVALPTYPFEHRPYWIDAPRTGHRTSASDLDSDSRPARISDLEGRFWSPSWVRRPISSAMRDKPSSWIVVADRYGVADEIAESLCSGDPDGDTDVILAVPGTSFRPLPRTPHGRCFEFDPTSQADLSNLLAMLARTDGTLRVLYLAALTPIDEGDESDESDEGDAAVGRWRPRVTAALAHPCMLARNLDKEVGDRPIELVLITDRTAEVLGDERLDPVKAVILGAVRVIPHDLPRVRVRCVDIDRPLGLDGPARILAEVRSGDAAPLVALRGAHRWVEHIEPIRLTRSEDRSALNGHRPHPLPGAVALRSDAVYVILGGLGRLGLAVAESLCLDYQARVV
ncbi:MAG: hypothetical protein AAGC55_32055, partial [Myxococcota bacterium]